MRLADQTIVPESKSALKLPAGHASGLYLIQLTGSVQPAWREQLLGQGVELLTYIPDDAFVARLRNVSPAQLLQLDFVRWVEPFQARHKQHHALRERVARLGKSSAAVAAPVEVSVLLAPGSSEQETASVAATMLDASQPSRRRFGTILRGKINPARLDALAQSEAVLWIEPARKMKLNDEVASRIVAGDGGFHETLTQSLGYDGRGVAVAVADSGLNNGDAATMHPDLFGRATNFFYYGTLTDASDGHSHGTHVAGIIAGNGAVGETDDNGFLYGLGVAPGARIIAQRIFDAGGNYALPASFNYETLTRDATSVGAVIGSNSWGDDTEGEYDLSAAEFDEFVRDANSLALGDQPYILEFSAGNAGPGPQTVGSPAVGKNVIATGASENDRSGLLIYEDGPEVMADFSSRGPCKDGRIKPDVVAPGTWIASLKSASATDENAWLPISESYMYQGGTSQAGPHVSGAAAVFVQYYRQTHTNATPSPALVKAAFINSAHDLDNSIDTAPVPNMDEGWGRIDLAALVQPDRHFDFLDQNKLLATGQKWERTLIVNGAATPLKLTLAYTDVPGFPGAIPALVNDLDLEVVAPDGRIYRGNQFDAAGESVPNASQADRINNVEGVTISDPVPGEYTVRVRAFNVVQDARHDTAAVDQDFALVISGVIPIPGIGAVFMDRQLYTVPGTVKITVIDSDLAGLPSVTVVVTSGTETNGLTKILFPASTNGVFTGSVATATGPAVNDAMLQIANGDFIRAIYFDANAAANRYALAQADLIPPVLTSVGATNAFGQVVVSWQSDEPATSIVRFGTNAANLNLAVTNLELTLTHSVALDGLISGKTYYFKVISADQAGNAATNSNGGALYSFVALPTAPVLLVDAYIPDAESVNIPVSTYTNALNQIGVDYDVWSVLQNNALPSLTELKHYRAVIWRINDSFHDTSAYHTLSPAAQTMIQSYLNSGGAFFMASMEILSGLGAVPFRSNVLQVAEFIPNPDPFSHCSGCDEDVGVPAFYGQSSDPVTSGMEMDLDYTDYPIVDFFNLGPDFSDTFTPRTNASPILFESVSGKACGMRYPATGLDSTGRVVFLAFPLDTVPAASGTNNPAPNNRGNLLRNILNFLVPGLNNLGSVSLNATTYTVPSLVTLEVADSDLIGLSTTTATLSSDTDTNGIVVTLSTTIQPGVFRGIATLVAATNTPAAGTLRAKNGDTIRATYFDASANSIATATALVDTQPAVITSVVITPDYEETVVTWDTSEPADSLVQYGESPFLGRTVFQSRQDINHTITLTGLSPDKNYYCRVVSRDAAGNSTTKDNAGQPFLFRTLKPFAAPWMDNLEGSVTNWEVQNAAGSQSGWTLGVPGNGVETIANSPTNCWGSNLKGATIDHAESFLISPAIYLTNGNIATLTFAHSYDFTDGTGDVIVENGQVFVITNSLTPPVELAAYTDLTAGWEGEELDLTPFIGHVVRLVWFYQYDSLSSLARPGWLVDDISVTTSNAAVGTIKLTNNLWQARFALSGPTSRNGKGPGLVITNAPPGPYTIVYGDVAYYHTPAPQTNTLAGGGNLVFTGSYTIVDANSNGIADSWEQSFFGNVASNHPAALDTDGDGASDYKEFISGTNPTNAASRLHLTATYISSNKTVRLDWPTTPDRAYRLLVNGTNNSVASPLTSWAQAVSGASSYTLPSTSTQYRLFRVQVQP